MKKVYIRFFGTVHSYFRILATTPPTGYQFLFRDSFGPVLRNGITGNLFEKWVKPVIRQFGIPEKLVGSFVTYVDRPPADSNLVITNGLLNFRREPWIPIIEDAITSLIGLPYDFPPAHRVIEKALNAENCKGIIYFFEATKKSIEATYETTGFSSKLEYVPLGVPLVPWRERRSKDVINLIFIGSVNFTKSGFNDGWFYNRGGHIAVKTFMRLQKEFDNLMLTVRSQVPQSYRRILSNESRVNIVDQPLTQQEFDELLWKADICLLPIRDSPWLSFLDAMNHELPIVTVNMHANSEIVNERCGIVCDVPRIFEPIIRGYYIANKKVGEALWRAWLYDTKEITDNVVQATRVLIKDKELRQKMGEAGRKNIEPGGPFSVQQRNSYFRKILDRTTQ